MAKGKKHSPEQIVSLLRQIEVAVGNNSFDAARRRSCDYASGASTGYPRAGQKI